MEKESEGLHHVGLNQQIRELEWEIGRKTAQIPPLSPPPVTRTLFHRPGPLTHTHILVGPSHIPLSALPMPSSIPAVLAVPTVTLEFDTFDASGYPELRVWDPSIGHRDLPYDPRTEQDMELEEEYYESWKKCHDDYHCHWHGEDWSRMGEPWQ
jgi:hypothetical protein